MSSPGFFVHPKQSGIFLGSYIMILLAAKMLRKLIDENNHKIEISVYQTGSVKWNSISEI